MNPYDRLMQARQTARDGRYQEALDEYVWFHEHALEYDPALRGVRLSYALDDWRELGEVYPQALVKLDAIRLQTTAKVVSGNHDWDFFHDIVALNEALGKQHDTYEIFKRISSSAPDFAKKCARIALPAVIFSGDFQLARNCLTDPKGSILKMGSMFSENMQLITDADSEEVRKAKLEAFAHIYAEDVRQILLILKKTGDIDLADKLRITAIQAVESESGRSTVSELLNI